MDLRDAVALSILPGVARHRLGAALHEAMRATADAHASGPCHLEWFVRWLGGDHAVPASAVQWARDEASRVLDQAVTLGLTVIAWGDARYPAALAAIPDPPPALWTSGVAEVFTTPCVAIVGSRAASPYALEVAARLARGLASQGVTVASGLARGVDSAAHRGALDVPGGRTIAVFGSGVDVTYPAEHAGLARAIETGGALVSELLPGTPPRPAHFPLRNRIISGLSQAVVVVEASGQSGSLITARCALEQGRDVMAVPGNVLNGRNRGSHGLIKDGAKVVETADDILEEIGLRTVCARSSGGGDPPGSEDRVLAGMRAGETCDLDALIRQTGLDGAALLAHLLELELRGLVARSDGGWLRTLGRTMLG